MQARETQTRQAHMREIQLDTADGLKLYGWIRQPTEQPKGMIAHVHGMGEHSRRYDHLTGYWEVHGYAAAGFDLRGHGRSGGQRGHTPSYDALMDDVENFLGRVANECPGVPVTLYGHSMGGNLVLNYVLRRRPEPLVPGALRCYGFRVPGRGWVGDRHSRLIQEQGGGPCGAVRFPTGRPRRGHSSPAWGAPVLLIGSAGAYARLGIFPARR
jgi:pimeloyl-ACP methyl ester carboxylesterase